MSACVGGIAHAANAATAAFGEPENDLTGLSTDWFFGVRANTVSQRFERQLAAIDYKIQRQQLHREDIRDLVELTGSRMDIYHIVGTLLLAFCVGWYTETTLNENNLPFWFSDLFLINNYAAVGYLLICVWLSMYAAIASRSMGARLLTSYARLSFPTQDELDNIKVPIFLGAAAEYVSKRLPGRDRVQAAFRSAGLSASTSRTPQEAEAFVTSGVSCLPEEIANEDQNQHFRRFLDELPRWLSYDTWSRVCMSFGVNNMLQALSYHVLGGLWHRSHLSAILSFMSIHLLGYLILRLDIKGLDSTWSDFILFKTLFFLPPGLAAVLLYADDVSEDRDCLFSWIGVYGYYLPSVIALSLFWSHGLWLIKMLQLFKSAGRVNARFKPGGFANVLEWVEFPYGLMEKPEETLVNEGEGSAAVQEVNGGRVPGRWMGRQRKSTPEPMDIMPTQTIRWFTYACVTWWTLAGIAQCRNEVSLRAKCPSKDVYDGEAEVSLERAAWPQPAGFFEVQSLHCDESNMWVSSKFSMYVVTQRDGWGLGALQEIDVGSVGAVLCSTRGCDALRPPLADGRPWELLSLEHPDRVPSAIHLPRAWSLATGAWTTCPLSVNATCSSARLAGWDGAAVSIANLSRNSSGKWAVRTNFEVRPERLGKQRYTDVKALHLSAGGRILMVLHGGGILDSWDLSTALMLGRLHVGEEYSSMCRCGGRVFLSRQGASGPSLASAALPAQLMQIGARSHASVVEHDPRHLFSARRKGDLVAKMGEREQRVATLRERRLELQRELSRTEEILRKLGERGHGANV